MSARFTGIKRVGVFQNHPLQQIPMSMIQQTLECTTIFTKMLNDIALICMLVRAYACKDVCSLGGFGGVCFCVLCKLCSAEWALFVCYISLPVCFHSIMSDGQLSQCLIIDIQAGLNNHTILRYDWLFTSLENVLNLHLYTVKIRMTFWMSRHGISTT